MMFLVLFFALVSSQHLHADGQRKALLKEHSMSIHTLCLYPECTGVLGAWELSGSLQQASVAAPLKLASFQQQSLMPSR